MEELKRCPFCGSADIYETYSQEYAYGTRRPEIFCNTCKSIFSVEDDSPYMNCDEDFNYRKEKTRETWNRRASDNEVVNFLKSRPSAQPEIIHCKDCKWYELPSHKITENCVRWMKSNGILLPIKPDDFCSYAERREE